MVAAGTVLVKSRGPLKAFIRVEIREILVNNKEKEVDDHRLKLMSSKKIESIKFELSLYGKPILPKAFHFEKEAYFSASHEKF